MLPRSAAGRKIVTEVATGGKVYVEPQKEKLVFLKKKNRDQLLGFRFGIHPESSQVIVTELYGGYPAHACGKIFVGDVLSQVNGTRVTEVDMATQLIKLAEGTVEVHKAPPRGLVRTPTSFDASGRKAQRRELPASSRSTL